ncbi:MAG TPA: phytanoyl-CoA dioxygenase family protein [Pyrinomonadaceae bacterium]|nr:phytanoyl-CoA dioxygenase family protein [Pyrinomonadaceae bacterium]
MKSFKDTEDDKVESADAPIFEADWARMSALEQRDFFAENGFLVIPQAIKSSELKKIHSEIVSCGLTGTTEDIWDAPSLLSLIENEKVVAALQIIFGEDIRFFKGAYVEAPPEPKEKSERHWLHVDYGIGERQGDFRNSCASWINVGYYLTNLTPQHAPFWVVPGSNCWYHFIPEAYMEYLDDKARMVLAKAGDAVLFHGLTVHATSDNASQEKRQALFYSYRPAWARPIGPVPEWPQEFIDRAPPERKKLLLGLNQGLDYTSSTPAVNGKY